MRHNEQLHQGGHKLAAIQASLGPRQAFPHDRTVLDLVLERVAVAPERPAIRYRELTLTYADLDMASTITASRLFAAGDVPRKLIPVLATDGPEFPISLIAVMKAGAAFVPLDPAWPADRLNTILAELNPPAIVGTNLDLPWPTVNVGDVWHEAEAAPIDPALRPAPADLIYGFYTSGSTGTPKCALNHHRGLVNRLTTMSRRFGDGADHVTLQNSRSTFDSSMWQVLWPLASGGQVVLPDRDGILDLEQTAITIGRYDVTITDFVPSVLTAFVSLLEMRTDLRDTVGRSLRRMLIGGEEANAAVVRRLRALLPNLQVTNTFGPTECSIGSVFHDITDADSERIPIGRAIDNTAAIVLDANMEPVQAGTIGEIYLGGECVGAGYLNDPERTARVFVANPFLGIPGEKLYRTGDLARRDHNGQLFFLGRSDDQVKVGGVRVELGDVASALASHPMVGDALAVVIGDGSESTLVGCVTPRTPGAYPSVALTKDHASQRLPAESVPHRIIVLDELPLNHNGKADRKAIAALLAAQQHQELQNTEHIEPPANEMEELVRAAWSEVLDRDQISVETTFADYGGTSLTAYQLIAAVSSRLGRTVRPRDLLLATTVRAQAKRLAGGGADDGIELAYLAQDLAWRPPLSLVLTGATGFIGAHIFADLLSHSDAKITCLIRCADPQDGVRRLTQALERYRLTHAWQLLPISLKMRRVEVIPGDLSQERLGLSESRFERMATSATGVVHAAGMVNFLGGYLEHRPSNVLGTQQLIKFASGGARVHALSTLSIFPSLNGQTRRITESQLPDPEDVAPDGYNRSKYVAEQLLATARERGVGSVVYRLGEIWPHRDTGVANATSVAHNILYACVRAGCVFETTAASDVTPVDAVSGFVARSATGELNLRDDIVHVLWPSSIRFSEAFESLVDGHGLERTSYAEFRRRLEVLAEPPEPDTRLVRLRMLLPPPDPHQHGAPEQFDQMFTDCTRLFDNAVYRRYVPDLIDLFGSGAVAQISRYLTRLAEEPRQIDLKVLDQRLSGDRRIPT